MIAGFLYNNLHTETILDDSPLILANVDGSATNAVTTRSMLEGETTFSRRFSNEYGAVYEPLSFTYSLFKSDGSRFTVSEQRKIEAWLTSPKLSNKLIFNDCNENSYLYYGYFTSIEWDISYYYLTFTFDSKYPYALEEVQTVLYDASIENASSTVTLNVPSDEYEEYIYPVIIARSINTDDPTAFTLTNITDGERSLTVECNKTLYLVIDCQYCRMYTISSLDRPDEEISQLNFSDVGQSGIDYFYFPRLLVGNNTIKITGNVKIILKYYLPVKKVGGWRI